MRPRINVQEQMSEYAIRKCLLNDCSNVAFCFFTTDEFPAVNILKLFDLPAAASQTPAQTISQYASHFQLEGGFADAAQHQADACDASTPISERGGRTSDDDDGQGTARDLSVYLVTVTVP